MAKEILFYTGIYDFTVEELINNINEVPENDELIIKMNSPGGSVFAGWGLCAVIAKRPGKNILEIEGVAASMGFIWALYFDEVRALDITSFMMHRAYMYVSDEDDQKLLDQKNKELRAKIEKRIDSKLFKEVTGVSFDEIFNGEKRRDVWITAKEAKKIGLVKKIIKLDPPQVRANAKKLIALMDTSNPEVNIHPANNKPDNKKTIQIMDSTELKTKHPEVYDEVEKIGYKKGASAEITAEKDRVGEWLAWIDIDSKAVQEGIASGEKITGAQVQEFIKKQNDPERLAKIAAESTDEVETKEEIEAKKDQEELEAAEKEIDLALKLTKKEDK